LKDFGGRGGMTTQRFMYIDRSTLDHALAKVYGTAGHLLKIWFTLKHMGLESNGQPIEIDTSNSTPSLKRLFSYGAPDNRFYIPFAHTPRYLTMKHDAARSIIQTNIQRWARSGSVVTCDPTEFLDIYSGSGSKLFVATGRRYPFGLGTDESGFALENGTRVCIPITSFAVWYGRQTSIPNDQMPGRFLIEKMLHELHISQAESDLIFLDDSIEVTTQLTPLTDQDIFSACEPFINGDTQPIVHLFHEEFAHYARRIRGMVSALNLPTWMRTSPEEDVKELLARGTKAILLFGAPRTGKTRFIDAIVARNAHERCTIQIHDGWGYDHLIQGFKPNEEGQWVWSDGPLKTAVESGKKFIILEEINRTAISQALGEVFSLLEDAYRGEENAIILRSGQKFWVPRDTVFFLTMNTVDKSTEDVDDALIGRVAAVEFPPRAEDLNSMLSANGVPAPLREKLSELFGEILAIYPIGHGYFADLRGEVTESQIISHYKTRIRPVLFNFLGEFKQHDLAKIDNIVDDLFGKPL
jgi:5-methylcytosine-specific restriction protein B